MEYFVGYPRLPKVTGPRAAWPESLRFGYGIQDNTLRFTMLFQKGLVFQYILYSEQHSFDRAHFEHYEAQLAARRT